MKKVALVFLTILGVIGILLTYLYVSLYGHSNNSSNGLIPVKQITGIYTSAKLKSGCVINQGSSFPQDDNGPWIAYSIVRMLSYDIDAQNIMIIDVYGELCTITFECGGELYYTTDYPLSNLSYNELKVEKADDGIKTEFYGSRYTLNRGNQAPIIAVLVILDLAGVAAVIGWVKVKKNKKVDIGS